MQLPGSIDSYGGSNDIRDWETGSDQGDELEGAEGGNAQEGLDEFGQSRTRKGKGKGANELIQQYSDGTAGTIHKDGTRSFMNGWSVLGCLSVLSPLTC